METGRSTPAPSDGNSDGVQKTRSFSGRTSGPARRSSKGQWTAEEDEILRKAVQRFKGKNWKKIAECFKDRTDVQCLHRWQKVLNPELVKGPWSKEEDETIIELVNMYGPKKWSTISQHLPGRIGKQCRERWHNHLNPAINKEAWTQEEEVALIRAHQIYGNRWAELTKFLPGRSDNSIKNHWNSSVKKKLDSYLASGLLEQFPAMPLVAHQGQYLVSSSSRLQASGDDGSKKFGREKEDVSECSLESAGVGCSQSETDFGNAALHARETFQFSEGSDFGNEQISSQVSCSEKHYASLRDLRFSVPEVPCEVGSSPRIFQNNFPYSDAGSTSMDYRVNLQELPNMSTLQLDQEPSVAPTHSLISSETNEMMNGPFQSPLGDNAAPFQSPLGDNAARPDQIFISDEEFCRILFSEAVNPGPLSPGNLARGSHMFGLDEATDSLLHPSSNAKTTKHDGPSSIQQSYCPSTSGRQGTSCSEPLGSTSVQRVNAPATKSVSTELSKADRPSALQTSGPPASCALGSLCSQPVLCTPMVLTAGDNSLANQSVNQSCGTQNQEVATNLHDGFIYANDHAPGDTFGTNLQEPYDAEAKKLVPVNSFNSDSCTLQPNPAGEKEVQTEEHGSLCYEPPRFPRLDMPFVSCDLVSADMQPEYSPFGLRQLSMSSMNCISPFRLWGSPAGDDCSDAVLRSASISKKRTRDLLSPLSDRRHDKKLEIDLTSSLSKEFSRLDVIKSPQESPSSDRRSNASSNEDKENRDPAIDNRRDGKQASISLPENRTSGKDRDGCNSEGNRMQVAAHSDTLNGLRNRGAQKPCGVIRDENLDEVPLFSPYQTASKADRMIGSSARTPKNLIRRVLGSLSEQAISESSSGNSCLLMTSPAGRKKKNDVLSVIATSAQYLSSRAPFDSVMNNAETDHVTDNLGIFGGTPLRRSLDSPSAWKSPWFSFLPGPRVDTEISVEDIGYFSPASYDALALMRQLTEHTAAAYADALEVLGNETPKTVSTKMGSHDQKANYQITNNSQSNIVNECRVLDFSDCGSPEGTSSN